MDLPNSVNLTKRFPSDEFETRCKVAALCSLMIMFQAWMLMSKEENPSGLLLVICMATVLLLVQSVLDFRGLSRRDIIHQAIANHKDLEVLHQELIGVEFAGWPVYKTVRFLSEKFNTGFHIKSYQDFLKKCAKELSQELASLPPGEDYDHAYWQLGRLKKLKSWKIMEGQADLTLEPTGPQA